MKAMEKFMNIVEGCVKRNKFEKICKMPQFHLKKYLAKELENTHKEIIVENGFVYAKGNIPVLLVAHMDTVHKHLPKTFVYSADRNKVSDPNGIGGDDRCGIYMILEVVKRYNCCVLFCEDEEVGGVGAEKFTEFVNAMIAAKNKGDESKAANIVDEMDFNYMIEFDRKGKNDAVFYDCDNKKFTDFICKDYYKESFGSFSDISVLAPFFGVAAVNLSCGYYNAHTKNEYVLFSEMERSIEEACKILERTTEEDVFEYVPCKYSGYNRGYYSGSTYGSAYGGWYDDFDNEYYYNGEGWVYGGNSKVNKVTTNYYLIEYRNLDGEIYDYEVDAVSMEEAVGKFCIDHPNLTVSHINGILDDTEVYM